MIKLTKEILTEYEARGLVTGSNHQSLQLTIYNYSRKCQYAQAWDEVTLQCRGLIMDEAGTIIARGFNKFFNYEEALRIGTVPVKFDYCYVQEKMDGSLGILFYYAGEWHMATRGSFHSDQAVKGMEIAKRLFNLAAFEKSVSYLCEIIYPENRIVVNYSEEKLVFLSASTTSEELHWASANALFNCLGIPKKYIVKTDQFFEFGPELYEELKAKAIENAEGFVLRFQPGNFRMKIKFDEYVRLHRLLTEFSNIDIWETLSRGETLDKFLEMVPDEFDTWVRDWERALKFAWVMKRQEADTYIDGLIAQNFSSRKEEALWIQENVPQPMWPAVFAIISGKSPDSLFWKMVKPDYQKPFWNNSEIN